MLEPGVLALSVLSDHNNVHVLVPSRKARKIEAVDQRRVQVEFLPQLHVQRAHATADRSLQPALYAHLVLPDRIHHLRRDPAHVAVDVVLLEEHRRVHRLHHLLDGVGDERSDPVPGDQGNTAWGSVAGSGHVSHRSGVRVGFGIEGTKSGALSQLLQDGEGSTGHENWKLVLPSGWLGF